MAASLDEKLPGLLKGAWFGGAPVASPPQTELVERRKQGRLFAALPDPGQIDITTYLGSHRVAEDSANSRAFQRSFDRTWRHIGKDARVQASFDREKREGGIDPDILPGWEALKERRMEEATQHKVGPIVVFSAEDYVVKNIDKPSMTNQSSLRREPVRSIA